MKLFLPFVLLSSAPGLVASVDPAIAALTAKVDALANSNVELTNKVKTLSSELASIKKDKSQAFAPKTHVRRRLNGSVSDAAPTDESEVAGVQAQGAGYLALLSKIAFLAEKVEAIDNCVHYVDGSGLTGASTDMDGSRCYIGSFQDHQISRVVIDGFDSVSIDASDLSFDVVDDLEQTADEISIDAVGDSIDIEVGSSSFDIEVADSVSFDVSDITISASEDINLSAGDSMSISASGSIDIDADASVDINDVVRVAPTSQDDVPDEEDVDSVSALTSEDEEAKGPVEEEVSSSVDAVDSDGDGSGDDEEENDARM